MGLGSSLLAQEQPAFPHFSVIAGKYDARFTTDVRIDPDGTNINLERDLGVDNSQRLNDFSARWRLFERHELAASYMSASRRGFTLIHRDIRFRNQLYPVNAQATTVFDTKRWDVTY